jgi:hypothetical protein
MILNLHNDLLEYICYYLDIKSLIYFIAIQRSNIKNILDNKFFKNYAIKLYGDEFWLKAKQRPPDKSKPLSNYYLEIIRIEKFQAKLYEMEFNRWKNTDFYKYWESEKQPTSPTKKQKKH